MNGFMKRAVRLLWKVLRFFLIFAVLWVILYGLPIVGISHFSEPAAEYLASNPFVIFGAWIGLGILSFVIVRKI